MKDRGGGRTGDQKAIRAILLVNPKKSHARGLGDEILKELKALNIASDIYSFREKTVFPAEKAYSVAITLGGDGTVLTAARTMSPLGIPIFPVNLGTFGFIAGVRPSEWREVFARWLGGSASISRRLMLEVLVKRGGSEILRGCCLNDAIISSSGIAKIIKLHLSCRAAGAEALLKLMSYRSDGLIVSTPTGSTAYSASAGGPIVDPEFEAIVLNPICPFIVTQRPMVLSANEEVIVEVDKEQRSGVLLALDGQVSKKLKDGDRVHIKRAPYSCLLIESGRREFYQALRTKLSWAGEKEPPPKQTQGKGKT